MSTRSFAAAVVLSFAFLLSLPAQAGMQHRLEGNQFRSLDRPLTAQAKLKIEKIPLADDGVLHTLELERFEIMAPNAEVFVYDAEGKKQPHKMMPMRFFRGTVAGVKDSLVFVSMTEKAIEGFVFAEDRKFLLVSREPRGADEKVLRATERDVLVDEIPPEYEFTEGAGYTCGFSKSMLKPVQGMVPRSLAFGQKTPAVEAALTGTQKTMLGLVIESDAALYTNFSSNITSVENYLRNLIAATATIYKRDLQTDLQIVHLGMRTTTDPWTVNPFVSTGTWNGINNTEHTTEHALLEYGDYWHASAPTAAAKSAALLISGQSARSGIAFTDIVCENEFYFNPAWYPNPPFPAGYLYAGHYGGPYSYCGGVGLTSSERATPNPDANANFAISGSGYWPLLQVAHELGHIVQSDHTHCISVNSATYGRSFVDHCFIDGSESCYSGSTSVPSEKGTIMSYCHNVAPGYGSNSRFTFGQAGEASTQVISLMRGALNDKTPALSTITVPVSVAPGATGSASVTNAGLSYAWSILNGTFTGGGTTATGPSVNFSPSGTNPITLTVTATNAGGCGITDSAVVQVSQGPACTYGIAPTSNTVYRSAGTGTIAVTAGANCNWTAVSNSQFINITGGAAGAGNGTVSYSFTANSSGAQRTGTITVAGQTFTLTQRAYNAKGDFNADGKSDLIWQNSSTFATEVTLLNGTTTISESSLPGVSSAQWSISGSEDFNQDGYADIIWRNSSTFQTVVWLMNGTTYVGEATLPGVSSAAWRVAGAGDFNGDNKPDLVWQNSTTFQTVVWLLNGTTYIGEATLPTVSSPAWSIRGVGDFNGDGSADVVWRNSTTFQTVVWLMNGTVYAGEGNLPGVSSSAWNIYAIGDYNTDGKSDLVWRNTSTFQAVAWLLNGTTYLGEGALPTRASTSWNVVGPK